MFVSPCDFGSQVYIQTVIFTTYYVLIHGLSGIELDLYGISATPVPGMENDQCTDVGGVPTLIPDGEVVLGSTVDASTTAGETFLDACGNAAAGSGVWYNLVGDGGTVTVTTCHASTNFDTVLRVYSGSCGSLSCVGSNNDASACGSTSSVDFLSTSGVTYKAYVAGATADGFFGISVTSVDVPTGSPTRASTLAPTVTPGFTASPTGAATFAPPTVTPAPELLEELLFLSVWPQWWNNGREVLEEARTEVAEYGPSRVPNQIPSPALRVGLLRLDVYLLVE